MLEFICIFASVKRNGITNQLKTNSAMDNKTFAERYNDAYNEAISNGRIWGFEVKDSNGEYQFDYIHYDEDNNTLRWLDVTIDVDEDMDIDYNLEGLYDEMIENGYGIIE